MREGRGRQEGRERGTCETHGRATIKLGQCCFNLVSSH